MKKGIAVLAVIVLLIGVYFGVKGEAPEQVFRSDLEETFTLGWSAAVENVPQIVVDDENVRENLSEEELEDLKSELYYIVDISQDIIREEFAILPEKIPEEDVEDILAEFYAKIENEVLSLLPAKIGAELAEEVAGPLKEELQASSSEAILETTIALGIGEWLIIGRKQDADILDIHRTLYDRSMLTIALLTDTLLTYDWNMNLIPLLAERYEVTPYYIDFWLRKDVKFHSGDPFNAEAVKYTIERAKNLPGSKHVASVEEFEVEIKDDYWVRVHFEKEDRYAIEWFATTSSSIVSPRYAEKYGVDYGVTHFDGTGPFKFKTWIRDKRIVLERNPEYKWGPGMYANRGPARIAGVILEVIREDMVRAAALEAGDINFMLPPVTAGDLARLRMNPEIQLFRGPTFTMDYIGFHTGGGRHGTYDITTHKWYDENGKELDIRGGKFVGDVRIRQAIAYAINKEKLIEDAVDNIGFPVYGPLTPGQWGYWSGVENYYQYNPEKARELLAEAGYPDGVNIELLAMDEDRRVAEALFYQLGEVGINLDVKIVPFGYLQDKVRNREHQMYLLYWDWPYADILFWMFHPNRVPTPNRNWWDREDVESVIDRTFSFDDDEALEALHELQQVIMEDVVWVPWRVRETTQFARAEVKGYRLHPWPSLTWKLLDVTIEA